MPARSKSRIAVAVAALAAGVAALTATIATSAPSDPTRVADSSWGIVAPNPTPTPTQTPLALMDDSSWG
ncbi:hypothetical protein ACFC26_16360 [Kitasatospora purpeofusca]|uniref:hypothetical protein n=1 Tax=Kitasatospora purpeofusca TaxID=67352 RepID=UPI0035DCB73A